MLWIMKLYCRFDILEETGKGLTVGIFVMLKKRQKKLQCAFAFALSFTRVKFGVKMDVIKHVNLPLESLNLFKKKKCEPSRDAWQM